MKFIVFSLSLFCFLVSCFDSRSQQVIFEVDTHEVFNPKSISKLSFYKYDHNLLRNVFIKDVLLNGPHKSFKMKIDTFMKCFVKYVRNDSIITESSSFYCTNESIKITVLQNGYVNINSLQNKFKEINEFLLFAIPNSIVKESSFSLSIFKDQYETVINNNYLLKMKVIEYERKIIETVKRNKFYYHTLVELEKIQDNISAKTIDTCLKVLRHFKNVTFEYKRLFNYNESLKSLITGKSLKQIFAKDANGNTYLIDSLASDKELILVDFWASWCVPCRVQMKQFKEMLVSVDTSKFSIISLNVDEKISDWISASIKDSIHWKNLHVSGGFKSEVIKLLGITFLPKNFLIDANGVIIKKDVTFQELHDFLSHKSIIFKKVL